LKVGVVRVGEVPNTTAPVPVEVVTPVPPLATARVPANVTAPDVAPAGVSPVVPPAKVVTPPLEAALVQVVPLDVNTLPDVLGATKVGLEVPAPNITLFAVNVPKPVPPEVTARGVFKPPVRVVAPLTLIVPVTAAPAEVTATIVDVPDSNDRLPVASAVVTMPPIPVVIAAIVLAMFYPRM
jgi:hypothetical protein